MLTKKDNELLTQTGPDKAMGKLFRFFWQPALLSEELPSPDCAPKRIRILNTDMVAFRDTDGRAQLIHPYCPHRGADLFFGRVEEGGIRCAYHGWKFDADGNCLDIPILADKKQQERMCERIKLVTYPTREAGGMIWVYLGPEEMMPEMPNLEFLEVSSEQRFVSKKMQESNWAQALEGAIDTAHFSFLHMPIKIDEDLKKRAFIGQSSADEQRLEWIRNDTFPRFTVVKHESGLVIGGARNADEGNNYWRISQFLMPNHGLAPNAFPGECMHGQCWVPIDDETCWIFNYTWNPDRKLSTDEVDRFKSGASIHALVDENYVPIRNKSNDYLIDREEQKYRTYTGITGVSEQDAAIQESMGSIVDRTQEHLTSTDLGIVQFRRYILDEAKALDNEATLPTAHSNPNQYRLRSGSYICSETIPLEEVMVERFGHRLGLASEKVEESEALENE